MMNEKTERDKDCREYKDLIKRLNRIEGQVRGLKRMLEEDRYCVDILTQVSAINSGLNAFNRKLMCDHIKSCVVNDIRAGDDTVVDELCETMQKLMK
ncbi:metal-sensing transcriptional repressor [Acidaminococcus sp. BV3L6]|uniref:metal-sensing transcriptional repressor n=1 Tax=Acidaminococcus sp. (strain BV3L6) TaxID=1111120 RepID=UPI0003ADDADA|nr:metal-sensing transcriptional repressor [Acidaminococcus sp. BV3L6]ERL18188.1 metal-sensitive transcriptional repressor [Acidaminococcus sp. BV3L6]